MAGETAGRGRVVTIANMAAWRNTATEIDVWRITMIARGIERVRTVTARATGRVAMPAGAIVEQSLQS